MKSKLNTFAVHTWKNGVLYLFPTRSISVMNFPAKDHYQEDDLAVKMKNIRLLAIHKNRKTKTNELRTNIEDIVHWK